MLLFFSILIGCTSTNRTQQVVPIVHAEESLKNNDSILEDADESLSGDSLQMDNDIFTDGCNPSPYVSGCGAGRLNLNDNKNNLSPSEREKLEER